MPAHQKIFAACLAINEKHDPIDTLSLSTYLEEKKLLEEFEKAVSSLQRQVTIPVILEDVAIDNESAHQKASEARQNISADLKLTWEDKEWVIKTKEFEDFLGFKLEKRGEEIILSPEIENEEYLKNRLREIAGSIDQGMQQAVIKELGNKKFALQFPKDGRVLDISASIEKIRASFSDYTQFEVPLVVSEINTEKLEEQGIIDVSTLVARGESKFPIGAGQVSRMHNIQLAAEYLNNFVLPPGEVFSTITALGEISSSRGYWGGLALIGGRYAPAVGGGICELSTDLFRAAVDGGYEILSRRNHSAVIFHYDWPQRGLDATIFTATGLDYTFRNNTPYYIVIQTKVDPVLGVLTVDFYSTKKIREVALSESTIYNIISPGEPLYITDSSLKKGQKIMVEVPAPGADVLIVQKIKDLKSGKVTTKDIYSHYVPWRAVYLVGE